VRYAGTDPRVVGLIGWGMSDDLAKLFCPEHHPRGLAHVELQMRAASLFIQLAVRANVDPFLGAKLHLLAGLPRPPSKQEN